MSSGNTSDGKPAARHGDQASCPTHGTDAVVAASPKVLFDYRPAVVLGDQTACGATIAEGSNSVLINGKPAAVLGCATTHGGTITTGSPTVIIGTTPSVKGH